MLDNKAKIKDIIASLQESEGINQKAELKSILVDKGITVEDTDNMASIVSKVNELVKLSDTCIPTNIKKDININGVIGTLDIESLGGKKWASGYIDSVNNSSFTIDNLEFSPSLVVVTMYYAGGMHITARMGSIYSILTGNGSSQLNQTYVSNLRNNGFSFFSEYSLTSISWIAIK